jgi:predicted RNA polymerase sigma factor
LEAMRLAYQLVENKSTNVPAVNALLALMSFHASRFEARIDTGGDLVLYDDQDETLWNTELIKQGEYFLNRAAKGDSVSKYHLEAGIAYWHTIKADTAQKWTNILQFYNHLLILYYSPVAALNRTYTLSKVHGKQEAITAAEKLNLKDNHLYFALLGELYTGINNEQARRHFINAQTLAKTQPDKQAIQKKIDKLN